MRYTLANSYNIPAVKTLDFVGIDRFEKRAAELGLTFPLQTPSQAGLTSALGGFEINLFDLVAVYSAFANGGQRYVPYGITRIENAQGEVLFQAQPEVYGLNINPAHAYQINKMLSDDNARASAFGRGTTMNVPGREVAIKTGTTNLNRDLLAIAWNPQGRYDCYDRCKLYGHCNLGLSYVLGHPVPLYRDGSLPSRDYGHQRRPSDFKEERAVSEEPESECNCHCGGRFCGGHWDGMPFRSGREK